MAIDSAEKRRNLVGLITGLQPVGVTPNVAKDAEWRQEAGWGYMGIAAFSPTTEPTGKLTRPAHWITLPRTCT